MAGAGAFLKVVVGVAKAATTAQAVAATVLRFVAVAAVSSFVSKRAANFDPGLRSRNITTRGTTEPQKIVYGEALVSGPIAIPPQAVGTKNRDLWNVVLLAGHECESISDVHLDGRVITNAQINSGAATGGEVGSGDFGPVRGNNVVRINKHLGTSTQTVDTDLQTALGSGVWSSNHRLRGVCYLVTKFSLWDKVEDLWETGEPTNVKALVRGKKVYDPRLDTSPGANPDNASYIAWSDNPALCTADYLRDTKFGPGIPAARIDWDAVETAADACDVSVAIPTSSTEKRFTCNGVLYSSATIKQNVENLLSSMNGSLVMTGGKYVIYAGVYVAPTDALSEDDIISPIGISTALDGGRVNTMKGTFIDAEGEHEPTETAEKQIPAYVARDGGDVLSETVDLPMTNANYMAQRIVQKRLTEANQELTIKMTCNLRAARLVPGERVNVTITERGWTPKIFKVLSWRFTFSGDAVGVEVELREDDSGAYADPVEGDYNTVNAAGALTIADPVPVPSVGSIPTFANYGGGTWNVETNLNQDAAGAANEGEIRFAAGTFVTRDGTLRTISAQTALYTPYEGSERPPDGTGYVMWGSTNPETRFAAGPWADAPGETAGLFAAIFDRTREQWYAVDNNGAEYAFTPADDDYVVYRFGKDSTSGGLDWGTPIVPWAVDPTSDNNWSSVVDDDGNKPANNATNNTGALADKDTVEQFDIELYAATRIGFSSGASAVSLATSGWKTLDSVDITLPSDVTDSIVLVKAVVSIAGNDVGSSTSQGQTLVSARLLDDDSTVVETTSMDFLYIRNLTGAASTRVARGQLTFTFRVPSSALNANQANTFTMQLNGGVSGYTSITGAVLQMEATLHNQSE